MTQYGLWITGVLFSLMYLYVRDRFNQIISSLDAIDSRLDHHEDIFHTGGK